MKCNWRRWFWGVVPILVLSWVAVQAEQGRLEQDLADRARLAFVQSGLGWAMASFNGRDGLLTGTAPQEGDPARAADVLRGVWGVRKVDNKAALLEKAEKYAWSASRRGNRVRVSGYAPNLNTRQAILGVAKVTFPGFEVVDRMTLARGIGSSDVWLGGVSFALKQLASLKRGDVRLEDYNLTVLGEAEDIPAYRALISALADGFPKGIKVVNAQVSPPDVSPFTWAAQLSGKQLVLSGYAPTDAARADLAAAVKDALAGIELVDRMEPGDGAPQGWATAAAVSVRALLRMETGSAELKDGALVVSGMAGEAGAAETVRSVLRAGLPSTIKLTDQIRAREPPPPPPPPPAPPAPAPAKEPEPAAPGPSAAVSPPPPPSAPAAEPPAPSPPQIVPAPPAPAPRPAESAAAQTPPPPAPPVPPAQPPRVVTSEDPRAKPCEDNLVSAATTGKIEFRLGSAELDEGSFATLDRLAQAIKACPGMRIEIGGHASAEGGAAINQHLSVRRARSVIGYMVRAGVDTAKLEPVGYGTTQPIAPNDNSENMARNRRIEFKVRPK